MTVLRRWHFSYGRPAFVACWLVACAAESQQTPEGLQGADSETSEEPAPSPSDMDGAPFATGSPNPANAPSPTMGVPGSGGAASESPVVNSGVSEPPGGTVQAPPTVPSPETTSPSGTGGAAVVPPVSAAGAPALLPAEEPTLPIDVNELPTEVPTVSIEIGDAEVATLEAAPWSAPDVVGTFIDGAGARYENIELNYRGAYALQNLVMSGSGLRNWKVKVPEEQKYRGHREWNFSYEPQVRHQLAYDLMRFAGVAAVSARHVLLVVNGETQGLYLEYEDPDNKSWLKDHFGSAAGDLYKAAYDLPGEEKYFAQLTYLGPSTEDYLLHYNKKLNNNGAAATDFTNLIAFIQELNDTADAELAAWFEARFDVTRFINYLVVSNFISNWDSYPQRPKNYWLYQSPVTTRWVFLPWDLDATFQTFPNELSAMGDRASAFFEFDQFEGERENPGEGTERPLVRRLMGMPEYRQRYVDRYRALLDGILSVDYLTRRVESLTALIEPLANEADREALQEANEDMLSFIPTKHDSVRAELDAF